MYDQLIEELLESQKRTNELLEELQEAEKISPQFLFGGVRQDFKRDLVSINTRRHQPSYAARGTRDAIWHKCTTVHPILLPDVSDMIRKVALAVYGCSNNKEVPVEAYEDIQKVYKHLSDVFLIAYDNRLVKEGTERNA